MNDTVLQAAKAGCVDSINDVLSASTSVLKASVVGRYAREKDSWFSAEDIVQDLLVEVYQSLSQVKATEWKQFCAWLRIVALRGVYKRVEFLHATKRGAKRAHQFSDEFGIDTAIDHECRTPDEIAIENEESEAIASIADLDPDQWQVFSLSMEGLKSREIAKMLDKPIAKIYQLHRTAKAKLELALS